MPKYDSLSREELLKLIEKHETELNTKKYGLIWDSERELEKVVLECENNIPILNRIGEKEIRTSDGDGNILIEGDNYHALTCLNYTHQGRIDMIYIDPPYNTGNKDFTYNDRYIDIEDGYRHSKWLNFMEKRLRLSKNLLNEKGCIFISIDDNEFAQLKILCDNIFWISNFIGNIVRKRRNSQANLSKNISIVHEYVLIYSKSPSARLNRIPACVEEEKYKNPDNDPRGAYVTMPCSNKGWSRYPIETPTGIIHTDEWRFKEDTYRSLVRDNRIVFPSKGNGKPRYKLFLKDKKENGVIPNSWADTLATNQQWTIELRNILWAEGAFNNPKPKDLIKFLGLLATDASSTVLDFFAGSGTTWHAVLELNKEDGGNRKFILCTNNENGICENVTYPRIKNVMTGYRKNGHWEWVEGLKGNLIFFRTDLIPTERIGSVDDGHRHDLARKAGQMIAVKEHTFTEVEVNEWYQIFEGADGRKKTAIYFRESREKFDELIGKLWKSETRLYLLGSGRIDKEILPKTGKNIHVEDIPEPISALYEQINLTLH